MSNDIRSRIAAVGAPRKVQPGADRRHSNAALLALAGRVAGQVADSLALTGEAHREGGRNFVLPADLYAVRQEAEELARHLGADPAQTARLARAMDRFAEVCATLMAAQPAAFSVEKLRAIVARETGGDTPTQDADTACAAIERASRAVEGVSW